jgi:hypothetical protein
LKFHLSEKITNSNSELLGFVVYAQIALTVKRANQAAINGSV